MTYHETQLYIEELEEKKLVPDHQNSLTLMKYLGNPQEKMPVIHVAGTNGKGSTIAYMASIYLSAGYHVGTFTSPHILSPLELVTIDGNPIQEDLFALGISRVREAAIQMTMDGHNHPTAFECLTASSLLVLSEASLDVAIIEVGMGGRYDATNVFTKPLITVLTQIDYDHTAFLGETLAEIAWHKGGIIRPGVATVLAPNPFEVIEAISGIVHETGHKLYLMDDGFISEKVLMTTGYSKLFHLKSNFFNYKGLRTTMLGRHQTQNLATALLVVYQLRKQLPVSEAQIKEGVQKAKWTCRGEVISKKPLIMVDGGHNPNAASAIRDLVSDYFSDKRVVTVLGMLKDKDTDTIIDLVKTFSHELILTKPQSSRAADPIDFNCPDCMIQEDYRLAIEKALSLSDDKTLVLIMGSLYLAYPAKAWLTDLLTNN